MNHISLVMLKGSVGCSVKSCMMFFGLILVSDREMETAIHISCKESSQMAGFIHILAGHFESM